MISIGDRDVSISQKSHRKRNTYNIYDNNDESKVKRVLSRFECHNENYAPVNLKMDN